MAVTGGWMLREWRVGMIVDDRLGDAWWMSERIDYSDMREG